MRRIIGLALAFGVLAAAAAAQVPLDPASKATISDILSWRGEKQATGFRTLERIFRAHTIRRGGKVHPLPVAARQIAPVAQIDGKAMDADAYMAAYRVSGLLVIKDGRIVLEKYALGRGPKDRWTSFSVAKSLTSTLVGAAIQDGYIKDINDPITAYVPDLKGSAYEGVSVRQMLMMSSGVKWNEDYTDPKSDVAVAGGGPTEPGVNPMVSYLRKLPRAHAPGTWFNYNTGETDLVGVLVANATKKTLAAYASEKIWKPYGMEADAYWVTDPGGLERGGCCISMTLRDYGRLGQFILDGAKAGGKPVVPPWWVGQATTPQQTQNIAAGYGYFWWMAAGGGYEARGIFGQSILTFPQDRLIIVTNSAWPAATGRELSAARNAFASAIRAAAKEP